MMIPLLILAATTVLPSKPCPDAYLVSATKVLQVSCALNCQEAYTVGYYTVTKETTCAR